MSDDEGLPDSYSAVEEGWLEVLIFNQFRAVMSDDEGLPDSYSAVEEGWLEVLIFNKFSAVLSNLVIECSFSKREGKCC